MPVADLGGLDWRTEYYEAYPHAARWIANASEDLSDQLPSIKAATLLLWRDSDPISPIDVEERLQALLPNADLHILSGASHDLAQTHAAIVAELIERHLATWTHEVQG